MKLNIIILQSNSRVLATADQLRQMSLASSSGKAIEKKNKK